MFSIVYARASSDPKEQRISVDRALKLCSDRARELWPDADVVTFRDDDLTAADPDVYRPGFAAVLSEIRAARRGDLVGIVVTEQSRLTRQGTHAWDDLVITLTMAGLTKVDTLSGPVSVEPGNRLSGRIIAVVDAEEVERTKARTQRAHRHLFNEGRPTGHPPFGYVRSKDAAGRTTFVEHEEHAAIVRDIYSWALQGHSINAIVERLNAAGVKSKASSWNFKDGRDVPGWTKFGVRKLLTTPTMCGQRVHTDKLTKEVTTTPGTWAPIVDIDTWQRVQRVLGQPTTVTGANGETYRVRTKARPLARRYLLSGGRRRGANGQPGEAYGILRCAKCGSPLVAQTQARRGGERVPGYQCHPKSGGCGGVSITPASEVEDAIVETIQTRLLNSPQLRALLNASIDADVAALRIERDAAKSRMLDAAQLKGAGTIDLDSFVVMNAAAKADYDAADAKLSTMTTDVLLPSADDVINNWHAMTLAVQRATLERLVERIVISDGKGCGRGFQERRIREPVWRA